MTAKRDIVVYKMLDYIKIYSTKLDGQSFSGIIYNIGCSGALSVENNRLYFCTDDPRLDGTRCVNKRGYKYSWVHNEYARTTAIKVGDDETPLERYLEHELVTFYQTARVEIGETYESALECETVVSYCMSPRGKVERGKVERGLHSFASIKNAIERHDVIAECVIPKGAKYYVGTFNGDKSYASDRLRYVRIVS